MAAPRLSMHGVSVAFGDSRVLQDVDLEVQAGEVHALLGENGAGKSTLMKVLAGALRPDRGRVQVDGRELPPGEPSAAARLGVAMIHQELSVLPHLSVAENIWLGSRPRSHNGLLDRRARDRTAAAALAELGHAGLPLGARVATLPPAVRQLVEIARALASDASVLVMDEPTSSLAADDVERLFAVIDRLRRRGLAIVYISHFLAEIRRVATTVTILRDGRAVARGPLSGFGDDDLVRQMAGRELGELYPERRRASGAIVLEARDLAGAPLPHRASFVLRAGEILGIGGLCGSGRSELLETLFGLRPVRAGGIAFRGGPPPRTIAARWAQHCGLLVEDRQQVGLAAQRPLWANLVLPSARALRRGPVLRPWAARAAAGHWVLELGVRCRDADQRVALLSGGNQQKVALARLLQAGADLLLLDEPTRGIDVQSRQQIYAVLAARAAAGASILLVSSQLPELLGLCDRIAVMQGGVLGPARPAADWTQESLLQAALGGGGAP